MHMGKPGFEHRHSNGFVPALARDASSMMVVSGMGVLDETQTRRNIHTKGEVTTVPE